MILDNQTKFSALQAVTASAASTNYYDNQVAGDAYDNELYLVCRVGTAFATLTNLTISIQTDDNTSFSSATTLASSPAIVLASLTADTEVFKVRVPKGLERYFQVYYTVGGSNATAGTIDAFLVKDIQQAITN
jgi:hypothetical protein